MSCLFSTSQKGSLPLDFSLFRRTVRLLNETHSTEWQTNLMRYHLESERNEFRLPGVFQIPPEVWCFRYVFGVQSSQLRCLEASGTADASDIPANGLRTNKHPSQILRKKQIKLHIFLYRCPFSPQLPSRELTYPTFGKGKSSIQSVLGMWWFPGR